MVHRPRQRCPCKGLQLHPDKGFKFDSPSLRAPAHMAGSLPQHGMGQFGRMADAPDRPPFHRRRQSGLHARTLLFHPWRMVGMGSAGFPLQDALLASHEEVARVHRKDELHPEPGRPCGRHRRALSHRDAAGLPGCRHGGDLQCGETPERKRTRL